MKIVAIRGKNLASLEGEFMIDFTVEPLCSAGIFAITGSTGAGKSTLLDALCLALFDCTPRMNRRKRITSLSWMLPTEELHRTIAVPSFAGVLPRGIRKWISSL